MVDGYIIYSDKMTPRMYAETNDPIRRLEMYLLGLKQDDSSEYISSKSRKRCCFFKKIWAKLFGE